MLSGVCDQPRDYKYYLLDGSLYIMHATESVRSHFQRLGERGVSTDMPWMSVTEITRSRFGFFFYTLLSDRSSAAGVRRPSHPVYLNRSAHHTYRRLVREPSSRTARCAACWGVESAASMPATRAECRIPAAPRTPAALAQPAWSRGLFRLFAHESTSARVHTRTRGATRVPFC